MEKELILLLRGTVIGLGSAVLLELVKHQIERRGADRAAAEARRQRRAERVGRFLAATPEAVAAPAPPPSPAWLKQVTSARRKPLSRLGLRSEEDYGTETIQVEEVQADSGRATFLKKFARTSPRTRRAMKPKGGKFLLGPAHLIGRGGRCDIQILDPAVSLVHALIRFEGDRYVLYDLGSTGGTFVDDLPVGPLGFPLLGGERLRLGETCFEFGRVALPAELHGAEPFFVD